MRYDWITPLNVVRVAKALLDLDVQAIQETYQPDLQSWVFSLQNALLQYVHHEQTRLQPQSFSRSPIELVEYHLKSLLQQTQAFIPLLTPQARSALEQQFSESQSTVT